MSFSSIDLADRSLPFSFSVSVFFQSFPGLYMGIDVKKGQIV